MVKDTVNVIGVGYIGSLISLHLADQGVEVRAIDKNDKVEEKENWFSRYNDVKEEASPGRLENIETSTDYADLKSEVSIICVNTPEGENSADLDNVKSAAASLGEQLEVGDTVILRSTVPPGTCEEELIPLLEEKSGLERCREFSFCYSPEFVRGGSGLTELRNPSKTVISGDEKGVKKFRELFPTPENTYEISLKDAEAVKYFDNVFHGLKISLANECGRLGEAIDLNASKVMEIISSDEKLNISDVYMEPGRAYGGPCLRKDIKALNDEAESYDTETPVISSINKSNREHNHWLVEKIREKSPESVGIIGATYKEGFNAVSNSPSLKIASRLRENDIQVMIHEPEIALQEFRQVTAEELEEADTWIIFHRTEGLEPVKERFSGDIIDLSDFNF